MSDNIELLLNVIRGEGGRLLISYDDEDKMWMVGMEWGREAPDSPMAGAASYGLQENLADALAQVQAEVTGDHDPLTPAERKELYGVDRDVL
jgi:hypothetical protein